METDFYSAEVCGVTFEVRSAPGLFSPNGLDAGTRLLLETAARPEAIEGRRVLDLGCGCGPVGVYAALCGAEVFMCDADPAAVAASAESAARNGVDGCVTIVQSDAYASLDVSGFDLILSNPPYHTDFEVAKRFIEKGFNRLKIGGSLALVVKRGEWYRNKLRTIFGGVRQTEQGGYTVLTAERRAAHWSSAK